MSEEITEVEDTKQSFDYRKEREERIKNKAEKAIFSELGVKFIDEIKSIFDSVESFKKQISDLEAKVKEDKHKYYLKHKVRYDILRIPIFKTKF